MKTEAHSPDRVLRYPLVLVVGGLLFLTLSNATYEAELWTGHSTMIIDLESEPAWAPPQIPNYQAFQDVFGSDSAQQNNKSKITRVWRWDNDLVAFLLWLIPIGLVTAIIYLPRHKQKKDFFVLGFSLVGIGLTISAFLCLLLYIIVGGWGPPAVLFFAALGVAAGLAATGISWIWPKAGL